MPTLCLIRHGQSQWNLENVFTGWVDVPLSEKGRREALRAGKRISSMRFDVAYTSTQIRAHETLLLVCSGLKQKKTPIFMHGQGRLKTWAKHHKDMRTILPVILDKALNERYYGDLQGHNKDAMCKKVGAEQVHVWRRSFATRPPNGESLKDTCKRTTPYLKKYILRDIKRGKNVLVSAHGNSLRAIVKELEKISDEEIPNLEIPTGVPYVYRFDSKGKVLGKRIVK